MTEKRKFIQLMDRYQEVHLTACAVSKLPNVDKLTELDGFEDYFVEPNQKWLEDPNHERAWVKIYRKLNPEADSVPFGGNQQIAIPMPFLGTGAVDCWGELQLNLKFALIRNGARKQLEQVKLGRHRSYDSRILGWADETKPIVPKQTQKDHAYVSLRFYHEDRRPEIPGDWRWEPLYLGIGTAAENNKRFFRIDVFWQKEKIVVTARPLNDSPLSIQVPEFLR